MAGRSPTDLDRQIGQRIAAFRKAAHRSQKAVAAALGITAAQFSKYEIGDNRISAGTLQALAIDLGVPVERFFDDRSEAEAVERDGKPSPAQHTATRPLTKRVGGPASESAR